jgi:hypothetical protein
VVAGSKIATSLLCRVSQDPDDISGLLAERERNEKVKVNLHTFFTYWNCNSVEKVSLYVND